jgi:HEAT repeat protein
MNKEAATNCEQCGAPLDEPIGDDYVERLIHTLDHPEPNTRATAALILGKIGDQRALEALCSKAKTSKDMALLEAIAEALGNFPSQKAIDALAHLLRTSWLPVRVKAAEALKRIGTVDALKVLREIATKDASELVRKVSEDAAEHRPKTLSGSDTCRT